MGELHLEIYVERMKREYQVECTIGEPRVNYRETITRKADFNYLHKKQSGGSGQFARVIGYLEPLEEGSTEFEFVNKLIGMDVSPDFVPAIE
jgi:elongation factor G